MTEQANGTATAIENGTAANVARSEIRWKGNDLLRQFLVPVEDLHEDPANANDHDQESIDSIAGAYARFGQQKPIVGDGSNVIRAGNGQLRAARQLRWTHLAVLPSDLDGIDLTAFGLADNETATKSRRDEIKVARLLQGIAEQDPDFPLDATGYNEAQRGSLLARIGATAGGDGSQIQLDHDDEHSEGFAEGNQFRPTLTYAVRIEVPEATAGNADFKAQLQMLCTKFALEYTIKVAG